jgi:predicted porin
MKVRLAATAALAMGFATFASAQSSVTMYGILDQGVIKSNGGTATNTGSTGTSKAWQVGQAAISRLGFRGREDLGGGLSAQFNLETRFAPDTGMARNASIYWVGNSYVQLNHKDYGSVWLGRNYTPAFYVAVRVDPFGWDGVGQLGGSQFVLYKSKDGVQAPNIVGYKSPVMLSGLTVDATVSMGEGTGAREAGFNAQYSAGPLYVGFSHTRLSGGPVAADGDSLTTFGASYNFGVVQPRLYLAQSKTGGGKLSSDMVAVGVTAPIGTTGRLKAAFSTIDPHGNNNTQKKFSVGYDYLFSKQTNAYFDTSIGKEQNKTDNRAFMVGIKKIF